VAFKFGVSGPFWYASGATIQVLLFAILAVEVKRKAPQVHTVLEIIKSRWCVLCCAACAVLSVLCCNQIQNC
jgi:Na+/proline symporter